MSENADAFRPKCPDCEDTSQWQLAGLPAQDFLTDHLPIQPVAGWTVASAIGLGSPGRKPTHHGGAPAEELEGRSLRTSLPFSPGLVKDGPEHLSLCQRLDTRAGRR